MGCLSPDPQHLTSSENIHIGLVLLCSSPLWLDEYARRIRETGRVLISVIFNSPGVRGFVLELPNSHDNSRNARSFNAENTAAIRAGTQCTQCPQDPAPVVDNQKKNALNRGEHAEVMPAAVRILVGKSDEPLAAVCCDLTSWACEKLQVFPHMCRTPACIKPSRALNESGCHSSSPYAQ